jgi:urease accessory protein
MAGITIMVDAPPHLLRLMHLVSPSLPTGAFSYSQGLEWAVEAGWVKDATNLQLWLADLIQSSLCRVDIPLLRRMMEACQNDRPQDLARWCELLLAHRETDELRQEEKCRGRAMVSLLEGLAVPLGPDEKQSVESSQLAGFALAAVHWRIPLLQAAEGYLWSWLENQVLAGIKIIPLGQTEGHRILLQLDALARKSVVSGLDLTDNEIGAANPALAIASSRHETQYTRLYRS